jgi:hypothetical protein
MTLYMWPHALAQLGTGPLLASCHLDCNDSKFYKAKMMMAPSNDT